MIRNNINFVVLIVFVIVFGFLLGSVIKESVHIKKDNIKQVLNKRINE